MPNQDVPNPDMTEVVLTHQGPLGPACRWR